MGGWGDRARLAVYFFAITGCFVLYSLVQERLMTVGFGPDKKVFRYSMFIVFVNRIVACLVAGTYLLAGGSTLEPGAPPLLLAIPSLSNVIASTAQYEALKYVSFPLQALSKCAKSIPVMAWNWVTRARGYNVDDYAAALLVTLGCAVFLLTGDIGAPPTARTFDTFQTIIGAPSLSYTTIGIILLAVFMVLDGLTSTVQDKLFASYDMPAHNQLLYISSWSALVSFTILVPTGQLGKSLDFVIKYPQSLWLMLLQSVVSTTVQLFIYATIKQYGALTFALMMTVRQFLSIISSCLVFQHELSLLQWLGTLSVVGGLVLRSLGRRPFSSDQMNQENDTSLMVLKTYFKSLFDKVSGFKSVQAPSEDAQGPPQDRRCGENSDSKSTDSDVYTIMMPASAIESIRGSGNKFRGREGSLPLSEGSLPTTPESQSEVSLPFRSNTKVLSSSKATTRTILSSQTHHDFKMKPG